MLSCAPTLLLSAVSAFDSERSPPLPLAAWSPLLLKVGSSRSCAARIVAIASIDCEPSWVVVSTRALKPAITPLSSVRSAAELARRFCVLPAALDAVMLACTTASTSAVLLRLRSVPVASRASTRLAKAPMPKAAPTPAGALVSVAAPSIKAAEAANSSPSWRLAESKPTSLALAPLAAAAPTGSKLNRLIGLVLLRPSTWLTVAAAMRSPA